MRQLRALAVIAALVLAGQAAARTTSSPATYKVKRGDTLSTIARRHKTTIDALVAANKLASPHKIREGQVLSLAPPPAPAPKTKTIASSKPTLTQKVVIVGTAGVGGHKVVKGDNLSDLAKRYQTTVAELRRLNNMKPSKTTITIGQVLNVPGTTWTCPVKGKTSFTDSWGQPRHGGRLHLGTDMFAARGTPVVAPVSGKLTYRNGSIAGLAFYLHGVDGVVYYGSHLDTQTAPVGTIQAGAVIGTVGDTGNAKGTTPHLHFEIHPGGEPVNSYHSLRKWCG